MMTEKVGGGGYMTKQRDNDRADRRQGKQTKTKQKQGDDDGAAAIID